MTASTKALQEFRVENTRVAVYRSSTDAGEAAAACAARLIRSARAKRDLVRVIAATGNSQIPLVDALVKENVDWSAVELFHMDEYVGIAADHPSSFRHWIRTRLAERDHPRATHYIEGDAADLQSVIAQYARLLEQAPIDIAFVGFGENGHIAFNDPPVADFRDPAMLKVVTLDESCRRQQAGEGHFKDIASVPSKAVTITCPGLLRARSWVCCVPEGRKAQAVRDALEGPISEACPASLVRRHPDAHVFLDADSASKLSTVAVGIKTGT
jgi:glucosamine-6-phosphate deaminase